MDESPLKHFACSLWGLSMLRHIVRPAGVFSLLLAALAVLYVLAIEGQPSGRCVQTDTGQTNIATLDDGGKFYRTEIPKEGRPENHWVLDATTAKAVSGYSTGNETPTVLANSYSRGLSGTVVVGSFFSARVDPQREMSFAGCANYFRDWLESIKDVGLQGVLIHDGVSEAVIDAFPDAVFVKVDAYADAPRLFPAEWRMIQLRYLLDANPDIEYVVATDVSDVVIQRDPTPFFHQHADKDIFFSVEFAPFLPWYEQSWALCLGPTYTRPFPYPLNELHSFAAGMFAGRAHAVKFHLTAMEYRLRALAQRMQAQGRDSPGLCDMFMHVVLVHELWLDTPDLAPRTWTEGPPLYNKIRTYEGAPGEAEDVLNTYYIVHEHLSGEGGMDC